MLCKLEPATDRTTASYYDYSGHLTHWDVATKLINLLVLGTIDAHTDLKEFLCGSREI